MTGTIGRGDAQVSGPESFDAVLDVTNNGKAISWHADGLYGGTPNNGSVYISIEPTDKVIVEDPSILQQRDGTVTVTDAGTYTVSVYATLDFGGEGGCQSTAETSVEILCDGTH